jgi:threonine dehydrogenase-like Zn-dependent dehydrogenase
MNVEARINTKQTDITTRMRSAVISKPKEITLQTVPQPRPGPDEVRIRLQGCGLCASSIPVWEGREWFQYPMEAGLPGHEGYGIVEETGGNVTNVSVGDRVAFLSYHAFAEYDLAKAGEVVTLPDSLADMPFPGEALGCAMNIFRRSDIQAGQTVAIVGSGFLGALLTQLAKARGARVIALSRREYSLEVARQCGADEQIPMDDHWRIIEKVKSLTKGCFCERVIECTGKEWPLNLAGELTAEYGKLIIAGFHQDGMRQVNVQLWNWRGLDVINAHERDPQKYVAGMQAAVEAVAQGRINPMPLYTHFFHLDELDEAFTLLTSRPDSFVKAIITFV